MYLLLLNKTCAKFAKKENLSRVRHHNPRLHNSMRETACRFCYFSWLKNRFMQVIRDKIFFNIVFTKEESYATIFFWVLRTNNFQPMFEQSWRLLETFEDGSYWTGSPYSAQYWNNVGSMLEQERIIGPWLENPGWLCLVREVGAVLVRDSRILWRSEGGIYVWTKWNGGVRLHVGYIEGWVLKYVKYALESIVFFIVAL